LAYVKEQEHLKSLKVILASSQNISGASKHFKDLGFDAILNKPVRENSLYKHLSQVLKGADISDEIEEPIVVTNQLRILVVEDNYINQLFMQQALKKMAKVVDIAGNGIEALTMIQKVPYDIVFMDINMPEMDGITATEHIKKLYGPSGQTPILALTADITPETMEKCYEVGMQDVLHKPVDTNDLKHAIERCFRNQIKHEVDMQDVIAGVEESGDFDTDDDILNHMR